MLSVQRLKPEHKIRQKKQVLLDNRSGADISRLNKYCSSIKTSCVSYTAHI